MHAARIGYFQKQTGGLKAAGNCIQVLEESGPMLNRVAGAATPPGSRQHQHDRGRLGNVARNIYGRVRKNGWSTLAITDRPPPPLTVERFIERVTLFVTMYGSSDPPVTCSSTW